MADLIERNAVLAEIGEFQIRFNETGDSHERVAYASAEHCMLVIKAAPAVNRWISCSERLPEHYNEILFCERNRTIHKGYMYWDGTFIENYVKFRKSDIVAWMPMPEPPEKE